MLLYCTKARKENFLLLMYLFFTKISAYDKIQYESEHVRRTLLAFASQVSHTFQRDTKKIETMESTGN